MTRRRRESAAKRAGYVILSLLFALLCLFLLLQLGRYFHPGVREPAQASLAAADLGARLANSLQNSKADALSGIAAIKKHYVIPEDAAAAPVPDERAFHTFPIVEAKKVLPFIEKARQSGLLEGQEVLFDPDAEFYHDSFIGCYYDETILMILWKEVIDGNTCSCCEIKIADASQFRRKIAGDTLGSPVWLYASELAAAVNPVVAMNADFYMFRDFGTVVYDRRLWRMDEGTYTGQYKKYNCIDTCFIDSSGNFHFTHRLEERSRLEMEQYLIDNDILFSLSFGPVLVEDGVLQTCGWYPAGEPDQGYSRAGIGQLGLLHYYYMSVNHSPERDATWTVDRFAQAFYDKGVPNAYCLDGGQTSEILWRGEPFNHIDNVNGGGERAVSDIIYFASALPESEVRP